MWGQGERVQREAEREREREREKYGERGLRVVLAAEGIKVTNSRSEKNQYNKTHDFKTVKYTTQTISAVVSLNAHFSVASCGFDSNKCREGQETERERERGTHTQRQKEREREREESDKHTIPCK